MKRSGLALAAVGGVLLSAVGQTATAAGYIRFDGIDGDVARGDHKRWCNLTSVSFPTSPPKPPLAPAPAGVATGGPGRIIVVKKVDRASPLLQQAAAKGTLLPSVELDVAAATPGSPPYLRYKLDRCFVKSWSTSGDAGARGPSAAGTETFTLEFSGISLRYGEQKVSGRQPPGAKTGLSSATGPSGPTPTSTKTVR